MIGIYISKNCCTLFIIHALCSRSGRFSVFTLTTSKSMLLPKKSIIFFEINNQNRLYFSIFNKIDPSIKQEKKNKSMNI